MHNRAVLIRAVLIRAVLIRAVLWRALRRRALRHFAKAAERSGFDQTDADRWLVAGVSATVEHCTLLLE